MKHSRVIAILVILASSLCASVSSVAQTAQNIWQDTSVKHRVMLDAYLPATPTDSAIIVCPGGSYCWRATTTEGDEVARAFQRRGIAAYVLHYRVSGIFAYVTHSRLFFRGNQYPDALRDVQKALQIVRQNHKTVGVIGFSAGGHLALMSSMYANPDFVGSFYPVISMQQPYVHKRSRRGLLGEYRKFSKQMRDSLSLERHAHKVSCKVYLMNCQDDPVVKYQNSIAMDSALTAAGKPHKYVLHATGGHGFGIRKHDWINDFLNYIKQ